LAIFLSFPRIKAIALFLFRIPANHAAIFYLIKIHAAVAPLACTKSICKGHALLLAEEL
jgi:hypothetical protein